MDFYLWAQETFTLFHALARLRPLSPFTVRGESVVPKLSRECATTRVDGYRSSTRGTAPFSPCSFVVQPVSYPVQFWIVRIQPDACHIALLLVIALNAVGRGFRVFYADVRTVFFQAVGFQQDIEFDLRRLGPGVGFVFVPWCSVWIGWHLHSSIAFRSVRRGPATRSRRGRESGGGWMPRGPRRSECPPRRPLAAARSLPWSACR